MRQSCGKFSPTQIARLCLFRSRFRQHATAFYWIFAWISYLLQSLPRVSCPFSGSRMLLSRISHEDNLFTLNVWNTCLLLGTLDVPDQPVCLASSTSYSNFLCCSPFSIFSLPSLMQRRHPTPHNSLLRLMISPQGLSPPTTQRPSSPTIPNAQPPEEPSTAASGPSLSQQRHSSPKAHPPPPQPPQATWNPSPSKSYK